MADPGNCSAVRYGIGAEQCIKGNPLKMHRKYYLGIPGFTFDTFADFQDEDVVKAAVAAKNLFPLDDIEDVEDASTEQSVVETSAGSKKKTRDGRYGFIAYMDMTLAQNKVFQGYGNLGWTLFIVDDDENIIATSPDGTVVGGFTISYFNVMPVKGTLGPDDYSKTGVEIQLQYNREMNEDICVALGSELDWSPMAIQPLTTVTVSGVSIAAFVITASFNIVDTTIASLPTVPMRTLTVADLIVIDQGGLVVVPSDVSETTTPGTWEITTAAMTSGTVQLTASATSLFESAETAVTV